MVEETTKMEKDSTLEAPIAAKPGSLEGEHERGLLIQETCNNNERVQEVVGKHSKRFE